MITLIRCGEFEDFEFLTKCTKLRSLVLYNVLISGRVKDDHRGRRIRRRRKIELLDDDMDIDAEDEGGGDGDTIGAGRAGRGRSGGGGGGSSSGSEQEMVEHRDSNGFVVFLKDEEEGQRYPGNDGDNNGGGGGAEEGPMGYYATRKRLEKLVNKLIAPICQLKQLRYAKK